MSYTFQGLPFRTTLEWGGVITILYYRLFLVERYKSISLYFKIGREKKQFYGEWGEVG